MNKHLTLCSDFSIIGTYQANNIQGYTMKQYTLVNFLTNQFTVVNAESRKVAKLKAVETAFNLGLDHKDNDVAYWVEKQEYHDISGYAELKAIEDVRIIIATSLNQETLDNLGTEELVSLLGQSNFQWVTMNGYDVDIYTKEAFQEACKGGSFIGCGMFCVRIEVIHNLGESK